MNRTDLVFGFYGANYTEPGLETALEAALRRRENEGTPKINLNFALKSHSTNG